MDKRRLGRTGHMSSVVIFGGAALSQTPADQAAAALQLAMDSGVNHIDIAPTYGHAQKVTGPWLESRRDQLFLGCKTTERTKEGAWRELQESLELLRTDHIDVHQFHAVTTFEELNAALGKGGAVEAFTRAKDEGLTRFLGITGHGMDAPAIQIAALERLDLDTVMFPLNPVLYARPEYRENAEKLLQMCIDRDLGAQIIKSIAKQPWGDQEKRYDTWYEPYDMQEKIDLGVNFALSQPGVTCIPAAGDTKLLPKVLDAAERFSPMSEEEQKAAIGQSAELETIFA